MTDTAIPKSKDDRVALRIDPEAKQRIKAAAEVRDGGNVSRLIVRAVDRLIDEENLLPQVEERAS